MKKIVFFSGVPLNDGATQYRAGLVAKKIEAKGYKVIFTSVAINFTKQEIKTINGLKVKFIGQAHYWAKRTFSERTRLNLFKVLWVNIKTGRIFLKILLKEKPDLVLVVTTMPISLLLGLLAKILKITTYLDIEDFALGQMESSGYSRFSVKLYKLIEKTLLRFFDNVCVCSHYLQKRYPGSVLIPNMIDLNFWEPGKISQKKKKIVFVGQMGSYHGQKEILSSLTPILKKNKKLKLVFIGKGEEYLKLRDQVEKNGLKNQINFTGQINQSGVKKVFKDSLFGLLPLWPLAVYQARHPLKLLEYMSSGLVVITNKVGEIDYIIRDKQNGIICPPGDTNCIAQTIARIYDNHDLLKRISQNARLSVLDYSIERVLPQWLSFLNL